MSRKLERTAVRRTAVAAPVREGSRERVQADSRFRFVGGNPSLDFVNTINWTSDGLEDERLVDYQSLTRWAEQAGVVTRSVAAALRRAARERPADAARAYASALRLRSLLHGVFVESAAGRAGDASLAALEATFTAAMRRVRLVRPSGASDARVSLGWHGWGEALECPLWPITRAAAELLASSEARKLRVCAAQDCGWVYVDRSRNGLRRWCEMRTCGASAKSRRYYARRTGRESGAG